MKKVLLTSTALATLLLAGGVSVSAAVVTPDSQEIRVDVQFAENATFEFNDGMTESATPIEVTEDLINGTQEGTVTIGGTLVNLTNATESVTVTAQSALAGLEVTEGTVTIEANEIARTDKSETVNFNINRAAAIASDDARVITVLAQNTGDIDSGETF